MIVTIDEETNSKINNRIFELEKQSPIKKGNGKWGWIAGFILSEFGLELSCTAVRKRFKRYSNSQNEFKKLAKEAVEQNDKINGIIVLRRDRLEFDGWEKLAKEINDDYSTSFTGDSVRKRYERHSGKRKAITQGVISVVAEKTTQAKFQGYNELVELTTQNTLIIGDTHMPFTHPKYLDFVLQLRDKYRCDQVVHIGDVLDNCAISSFVSDPDGFSSGHELDATISMVGKWYDAFPDLKVCIGNHDDRHMKAAMKAGLSIKYLKTFNEILGTDSWTWAWSYLQKTILGETLYLHGSRTGVNATRATMNDEGCSIVMGHTHSYPELLWLTNSRQTRFGLNVGCGIDKTSYAFAYGRNFANKVKLGAGVITEEGTRPMFEVFDTRLIN